MLLDNGNKYVWSILCLRRVCKDWVGAISRKSAPFLRVVVISRDFCRYKKFWKITHVDHPCPFWSFAENATTLMVCKEYNEIKRGYVAWGCQWGGQVCPLWESYTRETSKLSYGRINKVIYANVDVYSEDFGCEAVRLVWFQTTLYHCTLKIEVDDIFQYVDSFDLDQDLGSLSDIDMSILGNVHVDVQVMDLDSYTLKDDDLKEMEISETYSGPVAEQFARKYCSRLKDEQLAFLIGGHCVKYLGTAEVRNLVKQLIKR